MDVDTLEPGVDFAERIHSAVAAADVLLVVIGRGWLDARNLDGERRLDDRADWVRLEVAVALSGEPVVIPVLVGGATMPRREQLPPDLAPLARRNAVRLVDADWRSDVARLNAALRRIVDPVPEPAAAPVPPPAPPRLMEAERQAGAAPIPVAATALALAGAAALLVGTLVQVDFWAHPGGGGDRPGLGYFSSVAPMGLVVAALGALALSYVRGRARLGTGLLLGFALAGAVRHASLLGIWSETAREESSTWSRGAALALIGCLLLVAAATIRLLADPERSDAGVPWLPVALVLGGAALVLVGTIIPFNDGQVSTGRGRGALIDRESGWWAVETVGAAALAVVASLFLGRSRTVARGVLIGIGTFLTLLWAARYIGFVAWQPDEVSSVAAGGFVGLAGGVAILLGGLLAPPTERGGRLASARPAEEVPR
jgi:hypothetical protein